MEDMAANMPANHISLVCVRGVRGNDHVYSNFNVAYTWLKMYRIAGKFCKPTIWRTINGDYLFDYAMEIFLIWRPP